MVSRWLAERDWRTPHRLLEDHEEFTGAATLRRLGGRDDLSAEHWKLASDLRPSRPSTARTA